MARDADNDYYYDEGTLNEQLDEFDVYEKDGRMHVYDNVDDELFMMDGVTALFGAPRTTQPDATELAEGESALYVFDDGAGAYSLELAFYEPGGAVTINVLDASLTTA